MHAVSTRPASPLAVDVLGHRAVVGGAVPVVHTRVLRAGGAVALALGGSNQS